MILKDLVKKENVWLEKEIVCAEENKNRSTIWKMNLS